MMVRHFKEPINFFPLHSVRSKASMPSSMRVSAQSLAPVVVSAIAIAVAWLTIEVMRMRIKVQQVMDAVLAMSPHPSPPTPPTGPGIFGLSSIMDQLRVPVSTKPTIVEDSNEESEPALAPDPPPSTPTAIPRKVERIEEEEEESDDNEEADEDETPPPAAAEPPPRAARGRSKEVAK